MLWQILQILSVMASWGAQRCVHSQLPAGVNFK
jgi:hypothetical protein